MDITLPGTSGIEAMRRMLIYKPGTRVLIFSMHEDAIFAKRALQAGAFGYVTKASAPTVLVEAVHSVAGGRKYLSAEIAHKLALRDFAVDESAADGLSAREFEVLRQLAQGKSVREIAAGDGTQSENHFQSSIRHQTEAWSRYRHSAVQKGRPDGAGAAELAARRRSGGHNRMACPYTVLRLFQYWIYHSAMGA